MAPHQWEDQEVQRLRSVCMLLGWRAVYATARIKTASGGLYHPDFGFIGMVTWQARLFRKEDARLIHSMRLCEAEWNADFRMPIFMDIMEAAIRVSQGGGV